MKLYKQEACRKYNNYYKLKKSKQCTHCNKPNNKGIIDQYNDFYCINCLTKFYENVEKIKRKTIEELMSKK